MLLLFNYQGKSGGLERKQKKVFKNNMSVYRYQNPVIGYSKPFDIVSKTTCKSSQNQKKQDKILFLSLPVVRGCKMLLNLKKQHSENRIKQPFSDLYQQSFGVSANPGGCKTFVRAASGTPSPFVVFLILNLFFQPLFQPFPFTLYTKLYKTQLISMFWVIGVWQNCGDKVGSKCENSLYSALFPEFSESCHSKH